MRKVFLIFFTFIAFATVSYSSFPVTESQQTEMVEVMTPNSPKLAYGIASLIFLVLGLVFILMIVTGMLTFGMYGAASGPAIAKYIAYAIYSGIAAIVLGIIAIVKR